VKLTNVNKETEAFKINSTLFIYTISRLPVVQAQQAHSATTAEPKRTHQCKKQQ
jgi:hypothetical protein